MLYNEFINLTEYTKKMKEIEKRIEDLKKQKDELESKAKTIEFEGFNEFLSACFEIDYDGDYFIAKQELFGENVERGLIIDIGNGLIGFVNCLRMPGEFVGKFYLNDEGHLYNNGVVFDRENIETVKVYFDEKTYDMFRKF